MARMLTNFRFKMQVPICPLGPLEWLYCGDPINTLLASKREMLLCPGILSVAGFHILETPRAHTTTSYVRGRMSLGFSSPRCSGCGAGPRVHEVTVYDGSEGALRSPDLTRTFETFSFWGPELTCFSETFSEPKPIWVQVRVLLSSTLSICMAVIFLSSLPSCSAPGPVTQ